MNEEEYEVHVDLSPVRDSVSIWKEFRIEKCSECGRTPVVVKDLDYDDDRRYSIVCICGKKANGLTETACVYNWNQLNNEVTDI